MMLLNCGIGEDSWESLGLQGEIQTVHPKGDQSWIFFGRTDVEAETPILWSPNAKNWLIWTDPIAGKDWRWEEKGNNRGWDGWMVSQTQWTWVWVSSGSLWWSWCHKESDMTQWPNWTELNRWPEFIPPSLEELRILSHSDWRHPNRTHFTDENNKAWRC